MLQKAEQTERAPPLNNAEVRTRYWDERYKVGDGRLWGDGPSYAVTLLRQALSNLNLGAYDVQKILTVGAGYFRDEVHLAANGAEVTGYEVSPKAISLGEKFAKLNKVFDRITFKKEDFTKSNSKKKFIAFFSNRTLHLLDNQEVKRFVTRATRMLQDGGVAVISARNFGDFDPDDMRWVDESEGIAEYIDPKRGDHILHFWDDKKFRKYFGGHFDRITCVSTEESESKYNNKKTYITTMVAYKRAATQTVANNNINPSVIEKGVNMAASVMSVLLPYPDPPFMPA